MAGRPANHFNGFALESLKSTAEPQDSIDAGKETRLNQWRIALHAGRRELFPARMAG